jgi:hypothetical protein
VTGAAGDTGLASHAASNPTMAIEQISGRNNVFARTPAR